LAKRVVKAPPAEREVWNIGGGWAGSGTVGLEWMLKRFLRWPTPVNFQTAAGDCPHSTTLARLLKRRFRVIMALGVDIVRAAG
jgi:hypothetical protein